jgi:hypothetical protein
MNAIPKLVVDQKIQRTSLYFDFIDEKSDKILYCN